ncbi:nucleotide disphospho-sugar-binding domain-containing protein [Actinomadura sp. 7K534]|uniref:nucleotide disphospho-sugar-binding domain-containing protein n=1 Tax=Actinomadura sp. 7K534 TaxID=2530366 RepID=UPI00104C180F|nr:nucleotide disphospho-sugar-binding domain-containing protein [Actinomadura sp. 7K534]TDB98854.1 DUF1205 domain-containing protein [Actinomadura sp. 7K534]
MRVMICVFPVPAHLMPLVPFAWALQSAGHDVCVASPPGYPSGVAVPDFARVVNAAGLTAVPCGEPAPLSIHDMAYPGYADLLPTREESESYVDALGIRDKKDRDAWDAFYHFALLTIRDYHPPEPRPDIGALVEFARSWEPDLVLWEPWFPAGAIAAGVAGAAHARILISPDATAWAHERSVAAGRKSLLAEAMRPLAERYGLAVDDALLFGDWTVDPNLPGLRLPTAVPTVPARFVPYTGAAVRQEWLDKPPERPRVAVTLGSSGREFLKGDWGRTAKLMEAVADLDIEVVATLNANQLEDVPGGVPANVRVVEYVPLDQLLPSCAATVNHGSYGTFMASVAKRVPQLICDTDEPARLYGTATDAGIDWEFQCEKAQYASTTSAYVTECGAGVRLNHQVQSPSEIRELLGAVLEETSYREGTRFLHEEWLTLPSPAGIVPRLEELTALHRAGKARN